MAEIIFKAEKLFKKYKKKKSFFALNGFDMEIHRGDIYGFVGENGAGKTTLMRILSGWATQTSGTIALFGESSRKGLCRNRRHINGIIETPAFYPDMTAQDNLEVCRLQRGITDKERIRKSLKIVGLTGADADSTKTKNFSLGMKQRLGIAMALLGEPRFLFFAKLGVYFPGLLALILLPLVVSTFVVTMRNGFGVDWGAVALEMAGKLFCYIFYQFSMAGFAILCASVIQKTIGTIGISVVGIYLMSFGQNLAKHLFTWDVCIISITKIAVFLSVAILIFIRRDLQ